MTFKRRTIFPNGEIIQAEFEIWNHWNGTEPEITDEHLLVIFETLKGFLEYEELPSPSEEREEILLLPERLIFYSRVRKSENPLWTLFGPLWPLEATNSFIAALPLNGNSLDTTSLSLFAQQTLEQMLD